jgi:hypothetical protein
MTPCSEQGPLRHLVPAKRAPLILGKNARPGPAWAPRRCAHGSDGEATQQPWPDEIPRKLRRLDDAEFRGFFYSFRTLRRNRCCFAARIISAFELHRFAASTLRTLGMSARRPEVMRSNLWGPQLGPNPRHVLEAAAAHTCCLRSSVVTRTNWMMSSCACIKTDALVDPLVPKNSR